MASHPRQGTAAVLSSHCGALVIAENSLIGTVDVVIDPAGRHWHPRSIRVPNLHVPKLRKPDTDLNPSARTKRRLPTWEWADMNAYADAKTDVTEGIISRAPAPCKLNSHDHTPLSAKDQAGPCWLGTQFAEHDIAPLPGPRAGRHLGDAFAVAHTRDFCFVMEGQAGQGLGEETGLDRPVSAGTRARPIRAASTSRRLGQRLRDRRRRSAQRLPGRPPWMTWRWQPPNPAPGPVHRWLQCVAQGSWRLRNPPWAGRRRTLRCHRRSLQPGSVPRRPSRQPACCVCRHSQCQDAR